MNFLAYTLTYYDWSNYFEIKFNKSNMPSVNALFSFSCVFFSLFHFNSTIYPICVNVICYWWVDDNFDCIHYSNISLNMIISFGRLENEIHYPHSEIDNFQVIAIYNSTLYGTFTFSHFPRTVTTSELWVWVSVYATLRYTFVNISNRKF